MSLTLEQRTNIDGVPKAAELIEIAGAHALEASDRAILNLLYQHAHDSGRLGDPMATWEMPITALRPSKHNGTDRIRDSLSRLLSVQVKVAYRETKTGRDRILLTHLFESFDIPADEGIGGPVRFRVPAALVPVLAHSSRWGRIKAEIVCAMSSKYAIALYELVQLRANMDRCVEPFSLDRFRDLLGVPPGSYERGNDFIKRVINPAVLEVNGLSEYGVKVGVDRAYSRAPITGVTLGWWKKDMETYRETYAERQRSKLGRLARLRGSVEAVAPAPVEPLLLGIGSEVPKADDARQSEHFLSSPSPSASAPRADACPARAAIGRLPRPESPVASYRAPQLSRSGSAAAQD